MIRITTVAFCLLMLATSAAIAEDTTTPAAAYAFSAAAVRDTLNNAIDKNTSAVDTLATLKNSRSFMRLVDAKRGDIVWVYSFYAEDGDKKPKVTITENPRDLLVATQFKTILQIASTLLQQGGAALSAVDIHVSITPYKLTSPRAELVVSGKMVDPDAAMRSETVDDPHINDLRPHWVVVLDFTNGGNETNAPTATVTVLTGIREGWAFSADAPLTSVAAVKVDDEAENIELADTPEAFYVGLNYAPFGDMLATPATITEALQLKFLVKVSRRPSDSLGIGVGFRPGYFSNEPRLKKFSFLQIFDTLSPYVAYTRSRDQSEETNANGEKKLVRFKRNDVVIGLSLDLNKALTFLGGGDDKPEEK